MASIDEKGRLVILGRFKELIVLSSGHNISPEKIEHQLMDLLSSKVDKVMLIGHGRQFLTALISGEISKEEVAQKINILNQDLPQHKKIRKFIQTPILFTIENNMLTSTSKLRRQLIIQKFAKEIEEVYS